MKLFSDVKPELSNMFAAKCYTARTITRWLHFIIFLENTVINIYMLSVLFSCFFHIEAVFFFYYLFICCTLVVGIIRIPFIDQNVAMLSL